MLIRSIPSHYHTVHTKPHHKLVEVKKVYFPDMYFSSAIWLSQIPNKNVKLHLTREKRDDGAIRVWTFLKVCHHLRRALPCVASHGRPVAKVSTPVNHCNNLPVIFVASIYSFFELHLRHCKANKHMDQGDRKFP